MTCSAGHLWCPESASAYGIRLCPDARAWLMAAVVILLMLIALPGWGRTAFYYDSNPPVAELSAYNRVVLEPTLVNSREIRRLTANGVKVHAYVSIGEIESSDPFFDGLPGSALAGRNPAWKTYVADLTSEAWRSLILETRLAPLARRGFTGVFLDTLDSYQLLADPEPQREALAALIGDIQVGYPDLEIILNRGFEVLESLPRPVAGVAAESLYRGWDAGRGEFREVSPADRRWLLDRLEAARAYADEIVVIDYTAPGDADQRRTVAAEIGSHGFDAWVTDPDLKGLGTSDLVPVPRRIMVLHNQADAILEERDLHVMFGVIFDWLGFVVEFHDVTEGSPRLIQGVHAGVITWLDPAATEPLDWFEDWLLTTVDSGYPLLLLATLPTYSARVLDRLGLSAAKLSAQPRAVEIRSASDMVGAFESPLRLRAYEIPPISSVDPANIPDLELLLDNGEVVSPVLHGPWGGLATHPYIVEDYGSGRRRWLLDPYRFVELALGYSARPVFDTTTENGSRLLTIHVDGDGFPSRSFLPGSPLSAEVLLREFIEIYDVPHTVSVIEGEVAATGLYPEQAPELEAVARRIFSHPSVEIASHSYSHPFFWRPETLDPDAPKKYGMNLPIPGYQMNLEREITGSIDYINRNLAPAGKKVEVFLWTGSADPGIEALDILETRGLINVNGGNTNVVAADESHLNIWPQARLEKRGLQIYAPAMNENVYTNNWTGPFYGYRKAIETFELSDQPRRLKPISIYYHFYSATKPASIMALHEVYRWALAQPVLPVRLSQFAERVKAYHEAFLFNDLNGNWVAGNMGPLRTLRIPAALGYARQLAGELAGYNDANDDRYLHLGAGELVFELTPLPPEGVSLRSANARIDHWRRRSATTIDLRLSGHLPLTMSVWSTTGCDLISEDGWQRHSPSMDGVVEFALKQKDTGSARLVCR